MVSVGNGVLDLLSQLGGTSELLSARLGELAGAPMGKLKTLRLVVGDAELALHKFGGRVVDGRIDLPPFGYNRPPKAASQDLKPYVARTYFKHRDAVHGSKDNPWPMLLHPRKHRGAMAVRLVHANPAVRTAVGQTVGGIVVENQRQDGVLDVRRRSTGTPRPTQAPQPTDIWALFMELEQRVLEQASSVGLTTTQGGGGSGPSTGPGFVQGVGAMAMGMGITDEFESIPDGVTVGAQGGNSSVDIGTMRLKRMLDKLHQMYDLHRQSFTKYGESAKVATDNMRA